MAEVVSMTQLWDMDQQWNRQWYDNDQPAEQQPFPVWGDSSSGDQEYRNVPFHTIPVTSEEHATQGHLYGILHPFSEPSSTPSSLQPQQILPPQQHHRPSHSSRYPSNTTPVAGDVVATSQTAPPYGSIPATPHLSGSLPVLPSSPVARAQQGPYRHSPSRNPDVRKRQQSDLVPEAFAEPSKRRRSIETRGSVEASVEDPLLRPELSEDEKLLIKLKQEQNMPWKDISREFEERLGRPYQVPALQMRYKRLKERLRTWTDQDVAALRAAYEYWENNKFEIVAQKMLEFGVQDKWPAKMVEKKWEQLHPESVNVMSMSTLPPPSESSYASPELQHVDPESRFTADGSLFLGSDPEWTTKSIEERLHAGHPRGGYAGGGQ